MLIYISIIYSGVVKIWLPHFQMLFMTGVKLLNVSDNLHHFYNFYSSSIDSLTVMPHASTSRTRTITTDDFFFFYKAPSWFILHVELYYIPWIYPSLNKYIISPFPWISFSWFYIFLITFCQIKVFNNIYMYI